MASEDDAMTIEERRKYLRRMQARYQQADRAGRGRLLSEMEAVTGLHRKSLLRLLHAPSLARRPRRQQRGRTYGREVEQVVVQVWESLDDVCAERVTPALLTTAQHLAGFGAVTLSAAVAQQLAGISEATVARLLARHRPERVRLPRPGPERANQARADVPMKRLRWDTAEPGHCEVDLVHHGGASSTGEYAHTLQLVDVATGWSERVALLGRGYAAMQDAFTRVLARVPFALREVHPDNGSEFFNAHLRRFFAQTLPATQLSRSRPYHKNDNRFVEQKNHSLVRAYLGDARLDTSEQVAALNALYDDLWVYYNLFQPVLRLRQKEPVHDEQGQVRRMRRRWGPAQTPFQRLRATGTLAPDQQQRLQTLYDQTNPLALRQRIYRQLAALWEEVPAVPAATAVAVATAAGAPAGAPAALLPTPTPTVAAVCQPTKGVANSR
jgi:hypothetical protein